MSKQLTVSQAAEFIVQLAFSDSHVEIDKEVLIQQLEEDEGFSGRVPTDDECDDLVTGGDEGDAFEALEEYFPKTCAFLASYWE